ncbi:MAG: hypothetical protein H8K05_19870 [Nitrospira sp.]|nr:hypothetical protein [Nitrospira sp.]
MSTNSVEEGKHKMSAQDQDKQPVARPASIVKPAPKAVETEEYTEYGTFNGAVRRDHK